MTGEHFRSQLSELETAFSAGDVELLAPLLTEQVTWATAAQSPWQGRQEVLERLSRFFDRHRYVLRFYSTQVDFNERRAVGRTNFESWVDSTPETGGEPHRGSAVIFWALEDRWRITAYLDVGTELF